MNKNDAAFGVAAGYAIGSDIDRAGLTKRELFAIEILNGLFSTSKPTGERDIVKLVKIAVMTAEQLADYLTETET